MFFLSACFGAGIRLNERHHPLSRNSSSKVRGSRTARHQIFNQISGASLGKQVNVERVVGFSGTSITSCLYEDVANLTCI